MRHDPASGAIVVMLRSLKMHGMAQAVTDLMEQGSPAFEAAIPILSQLLKAETAEREVRSVAYQLKIARFPVYRDLAGFDFAAQLLRHGLHSVADPQDRYAELEHRIRRPRGRVLGHGGRSSGQDDSPGGEAARVRFPTPAPVAMGGSSPPMTGKGTARTRSHRSDRTAEGRTRPRRGWALPIVPPRPTAAPAPSDFIRDLVAQQVAEGRYPRIHTRFPPEPNGYLHIGHAKSICLNFGITREFGGVCNLRMDDTNPELATQEYADAIADDLRWLGWDWGEHLYYASDHFGDYYAYAEQLVRQGDAYVDSVTGDEMARLRGDARTPGTPSPYRSRTPEENLDLLRRMRAGEFAEAKARMIHTLGIDQPLQPHGAANATNAAGSCSKVSTQPMTLDAMMISITTDVARPASTTASRRRWRVRSRYTAATKMAGVYAAVP